MYSGGSHTGSARKYRFHAAWRTADSSSKVRMLFLGEHPRPERHVAQVPASGESFGIPRIAPDMTNPEPGPPLDWASSVFGPCVLRVRVVAERDRATPPQCRVAALSIWIVLSAGSGPLRIPRRSALHRIGMSEERVLERSAHDSGAALPQKPLQVVDRRRQRPLPQLDPDLLQCRRLRISELRFRPRRRRSPQVSGLRVHRSADGGPLAEHLQVQRVVATRTHRQCASAVSTSTTVKQRVTSV